MRTKATPEAISNACDQLAPIQLAVWARLLGTELLAVIGAAEGNEQLRNLASACRRFPMAESAENDLGISTITSHASLGISVVASDSSSQLKLPPKGRIVAASIRHREHRSL